ncbi:tRNA pseudouridine synthase Pus10-like [Lytechinus variegatus]|uniref:tRNA pseudouridine synthase Pus10-like n=1 Tax=Lytechinus variegatus TaxID=7654 RepID=UPI001BB2646E|nr:tRNA pseudouridine synthase Pus10-like [Lytechinus variegatus]
MDDESKTVLMLRSLRCCQRCVLRYLGRKNIHVYANPLESCPSLWKLEDGEGGPKQASTDSEVVHNPDQAEQSELKSEGSKDGEICPACLGILQSLCDERTVDKICCDVEALNYDFKTYMLTLTLPLQLDIRQHCLLTHLNEICKLSLKSTDITPIKDVFKWVCGRLFSYRFKVKFSPKSSFEVGLSFEHHETQGEVDTLYDEITDKEPAHKRQKFWKNSHKKKEGPTKQLIGSALRGLTSRHLKRLLPHPPVIPQSGSSYSIECLHESVFLAGRYTKHSRHLSQTPWILEGERKTESSVEEHICKPIQEALRAADYRFASSGREDVDVRTLGRGRPFVVEVVNPRKNIVCVEECKGLQEEINKRTSDVGVRDLQIVGKDATMKLKEGETEKKKSYMALVRVASPVCQEDLDKLNTDQEIVLKQKTPIRVLHRRPLATRERSVHSMTTERVDDLNFKLFLCTQAGTYIKEFVHGDLGRTQPNVGTILNTDADITELDVTAVHVDWPPELDDS